MKGFGALVIWAITYHSISQCVSAKSVLLLDSGDIPKVRVKRATVKNATCLFASDKKVAVEEHNRARREATPAASNMMKMIWDERLGQTAEAYSRQCTFAHSKGRRAANFSYVGENIYISSFPRPAAQVLRNSIVAWDNEKKDFDFALNGCKPGKKCGHYTQVVWARSYAVGCGVTTCRNVVINEKVWSTAQIVICHYGPGGNIVGMKPYIWGTTCSQCPMNGGKQCVNNLCPASATQQELTDSRCSGSTSSYHYVVFSFFVFVTVVLNEA